MLPQQNVPVALTDTVCLIQAPWMLICVVLYGQDRYAGFKSAILASEGVQEDPMQLITDFSELW